MVVLATTGGLDYGAGLSFSSLAQGGSSPKMPGQGEKSALNVLPAVMKTAFDPGYASAGQERVGSSVRRCRRRCRGGGTVAASSAW